jgi:hypothetical protein
MEGCSYFSTPSPLPNWTASTDAVRFEIEQLKAVPFFDLESHGLNRGQFAAVGVLLRRTDFGGTEKLRVRLEYPPTFPAAEPLVFDHDQAFQPSRDGHQFESYQLCLRFPGRDVFSHQADSVTIEVLGAAWHWMVKRNIYERTKAWPDNAEKHGFAAPLHELALESASTAGDGGFLTVWVELAIANRRNPRWNAPCPCLSGRSLRRCHSHLASLIEVAIKCAVQEEEHRQ